MQKAHPSNNPLLMDSRHRQKTQAVYLILTGIFISALVTSNLIFQKFFHWDVGFHVFELSVGILPYPVTFFVTDVISELYGRKKANQVVLAGLFASLFTLCIILVSDAAVAAPWSPISDAQFHTMFGVTFIGVGASMAAYLCAQLIDVQLFHFWKRLTRGRHLWLRNNASTFTSQFVDTSLVLILLCSFGVLDWDRFWLLFWNGFFFKVLVAISDTPLIYVTVWWARRYLGLQGDGVEIPEEAS